MNYKQNIVEGHGNRHVPTAVRTTLLPVIYRQFGESERQAFEARVLKARIGLTTPAEATAPAPAVEF